MNISYDYTDLIKEIKSDILNGNLKIDDEIEVIRKWNVTKNYEAIVDYTFPDIPYKAKEINQGERIEKRLVRDVLAEMEKMNCISDDEEPEFNIVDLIIQSRLTPYRISKDTGIAQTTLSHWINGTREVNLSALKLVYYLSKNEKELKQNIEKLIKKIG